MGRATGGGAPDLPPIPGDGSSVEYLKAIYEILNKWAEIGEALPEIVLVSLTTGALVQVVQNTPMPIVRGVIQNLSTEAVTIFSGPGIGGSGIILNAATAAGTGGGTLSVGNIDLAKLRFVRTTAGLTLAIYTER